MKRFTLFFGLLLLAAVTFAQAPQAFNYQAVVRDAEGNLLENQAVGIKISLLQGSATGLEIYAETHATTTNQFGQVDLQIGTGTIVSGQFDTIAWGTGPYYLQLAVDLTGGSNYAVMGTTQMLSVPYALYAEIGSGWEKIDDGITYLGGKVGIGRASLTGSNTNLQIQVSDPIDGGLRIFNSDTTANNDALFRIDANPSMLNAFRVQRDGKIGIGINPPQYELTFGSTNDRIGFYSDATHYSFIEFYNSETANMTFKTKNAAGGGFIFDGGNIGIGTDTPVAPLHVKNPTIQDGAAVRFHHGAGSCKVLHIVEGFGSSNHYGLFIGKEDYSEAVLVTKSSNVGIGTTTPTYPLTVNGTIRSKKVIVDTGWSDFVFEDDYDLMPLESLARFIEKNNHLPEIPSAKEVEVNGISLGDMDAKLLQKIEELTLYTIEQQKMIDELVKKNEELAKKVEKIEKRR